MSRPGLNTSNYVLNIVELQNTVTSASGLSPINVLSNQVQQIAQMVNFNEKRIAANVLSAFNASSIQVISPLNLSNVSITSNGAPAGSGGTILGTTSSFLTVGDTGLTLTQSGTTTFSVLSNGAAVFSSSVTADSFITASDRALKTGIRPITNYETILSSIHGVHFNWKTNGKKDVGVIAQDLQDVIPEAVHMIKGGVYGVSYFTLVPVLIEAVKSLQTRVSTLEALTGSFRKE
jgi:hypothetical protein